MTNTVKTYSKSGKDDSMVCEPVATYSSGASMSAFHSLPSAEKFARAVAMDEAEYEEMKAHSFYANGSKAPRHPLLNTLQGLPLKTKLSRMQSLAICIKILYKTPTKKAECEKLKY